MQVLPAQSWASLVAPPLESLRFALVSPWVRGKPGPPDWPDLVAALAERCRLLSHFFCDEKLVEDAPVWRLLGQETCVRSLALAPEALDRHSARQGRKMSLKGWTATWEAADLPPALAPLLAAGEVLGVGKGAAWGMGRFQVEGASMVSPFSAQS